VWQGQDSTEYSCLALPDSLLDVCIKCQVGSRVDDDINFSQQLLLVCCRQPQLRVLYIALHDADFGKGVGAACQSLVMQPVEQRSTQQLLHPITCRKVPLGAHQKEYLLDLNGNEVQACTPITSTINFEVQVRSKDVICNTVKYSRKVASLAQSCPVHSTVKQSATAHTSVNARSCSRQTEPKNPRPPVSKTHPCSSRFTESAIGGTLAITRPKNRCLDRCRQEKTFLQNQII